MLRLSLVRHAHFGGGSPSQAPFRKAAEKVTIGAGSSSGRIALRNAVEKSLISRSLSETAPRVLSLHRDLLRSVPWVKRAYAVIMPESVRRPHPPSMFNQIPCPGVARPNLTQLSAHPVQEMRAHISKAFRDKKDMTDVAQVSKMVAYGRMELEETLMLCAG